MLPRDEPPPGLASAPRLVRAPSEAERGRLNELVSLAALRTPETSYLQPAAPDRDKLARLVAASLDATPQETRTAPPAAPSAGTRVAVLEPDPQAKADGASLSDAGPADAIGAGWSNGWASQPEFDEDHPEELSYRPFPIAPFLTQSASADDEALVTLVHPDVMRTLELLDDRPIVLPLKLRPGLQVAETMWAQQFRGDAVDVSALEEAQSTRQALSRLASHSVKTTTR